MPKEQGPSAEKRKWGPLPKTPYEALGISPGASKDEIRSAWKKMSRKYHPDVNPDNKEEATEWVQIINEAKELLLNPNFKATHFADFRNKAGAGSTYRKETRTEQDARARARKQQEDDAADRARRRQAAEDAAARGRQRRAEEEARENQEHEARARQQAEEAKKAAEKKAEKEKTFEDEIESFIQDIGIDEQNSKDFEKLTLPQKLKIVQDLKRRIVDIIKEDAETQYSDFVKNSSGFTGFLNKIRSITSKERDTRDLENTLFKKLKESPEGKAIISQNISLLIESTKDKDIGITPEGKVSVIYIKTSEIENLTPEEQKEVLLFNLKASVFTTKPYEWGQEKSGKNKRNYEQAKKEYEEAREKVLKIKTNREKEKGMATLDLLMIDNQIKMEQILNTHPEAEKLLSDFSKTAGYKDLLKDTGKILNTITGGKKWENKLLFIGGYGARIGLKALTAATTITGLGAVGTFAVGGVLGGLKARYRAKETLEERQKQARRGKEDTSKEKKLNTDVTQLNKRLTALIEELKKPDLTPEAKAKALSMLAARIEHTQGKIEKGLVNFGDAKSTLINQFNLIKNLNDALVLREIHSSEINIQTKERIDKLVKTAGDKILEKTTEAQKDFIKKQMWQGAAYGAGFATAGYVARWAGEHFGWWGHHAETTGTTRHDDLNTQTPKVPQTPDGSKTDALNEQKIPNIKAPDISHFTPPDNYDSLHTEFPKATIDDVKPGFHTPEDHHVEVDDGKFHFKPTQGPEDTTHTTAPITEPTVSTPAEHIDLKDATIGNGEGIEHAFRKQIEHDPKLAEALAKSLKFKGDLSDPKVLHEFSGSAAHRVAIEHGYVDSKTGEEVWVKTPGKVAYELKLDGDKVIVNERMADGTGAVETHNVGDKFEGDKTSAYEMKHARVSGNSIDNATSTETPSSINTDTATPAPTPEQIQKDLDGIFAKLNEQSNADLLDQNIPAASSTAATPESYNAVTEQIIGNPYNLGENTLREIDTIYTDSIKKSMPNLQYWESMGRVRASEILGKGDNADFATANTSPAYLYLNKIFNVTHLKPKTGWFVFGEKETADKYVARALQYAAKNGLLDKIKDILK